MMDGEVDGSILSFLKRISLDRLKYNGSWSCLMFLESLLGITIATFSFFLLTFSETMVFFHICAFLF